MALAVARVLPVLDAAPDCIFKALTGLPCPTCGTTHALVSMGRGDLFASFRANPLAAFLLLLSVAVFLVGIVFRLSTHTRISLVLTGREERIARITAILLVLANWSYLIISR